MGRDSGPVKRQPVEGRDWGKWDYRKKRSHETQTNSAAYRANYEKTFGMTCPVCQEKVKDMVRLSDFEGCGRCYAERQG